MNEPVGIEHANAEAAKRIAELEFALASILEVAERAVQLSRDHAEFRLYAMEPMDRAINTARAALKGGE